MYEQSAKIGQMNLVCDSKGYCQDQEDEPLLVESILVEEIHSETNIQNLAHLWCMSTMPGNSIITPYNVEEPTDKDCCL